MLAVDWQPPRNYVRAALRHRHIPDFWLEDAIQDVMLNCWLAGSPWINYAVIDAARKYGPYKRGRKWRVIPGPLPHENFLPRLDPYPAIDAWIDAERAIESLTSQQRRNLFAPYDGVNATQVKRYQARKLLRKSYAGI